MGAASHAVDSPLVCSTTLSLPEEPLPFSFCAFTSWLLSVVICSAGACPAGASCRAIGSWSTPSAAGACSLASLPSASLFRGVLAFFPLPPLRFFRLFGGIPENYSVALS